MTEAPEASRVLTALKAETISASASGSASAVSTATRNVDGLG
jgi:hypothetical protein